ncbi:hypothetical protein SELMODRAFT_168621 [Selaginella moellendorffii]|uniref:Peroxidase n=2 Tax=Selaginella moellendorffii TaxID=88036 RepID=D8R725_SELML|nr:hypothetical protein SELMODRAFT_168621 [Selaginella moellendorffii]
MELVVRKAVAALVVSVVVTLVRVEAQLVVGYYEQNGCPMAEEIVKKVLTAAVARDQSIAASLLRLHFHDCFVQGCDGSVLLDPQNGFPATEKQAVPNFSLRGYNLVDAIKQALEQACPETVSCADILAIAARDAVSLSGGGTWPVETGRRDGVISLRTEAENLLPPTNENSEVLTQRFLDVGLTQDEMITLSGAHTIGRAHCVSFSQRLYNFSPEFDTDPNLDAAYAGKLKQACPRNFDPRTVVPLDPVTPSQFDNRYYSNLVNNMGLMISDQTLHSDMLTQFSSESNAEDENMWQFKFANAMVRMGAINVKAEGEIRKNCRLRN